MGRAAQLFATVATVRVGDGMSKEDIESTKKAIDESMSKDFSQRERNLITTLMAQMMLEYDEAVKKAYGYGFWVGAATASLVWWYFYE